jgi:hypothetical protein
MVLAIFAFSARMVDNALNLGKEQLKKEWCEDSGETNDDDSQEENDEEPFFQVTDWIVEALGTSMVLIESDSKNTAHYRYHFSIGTNNVKPPYCPPERA